MSILRRDVHQTPSSPPTMAYGESGSSKSLSTSMYSRSPPAPRLEHWYAVQTKSRQEARAAMNLTRWGVENFLPLARVLKSARRPGKRIEPLFPGYLFVRCALEAMASKISFTRGVSRLVTCSGQALPIDGAIMDAIRERMNPDGVVEIAPTLKVGDHVRVIHGDFKDFVGVLETSSNSEARVRLLLSVIGGWRLVLSADAVQKIR